MRNRRRHGPGTREPWAAVAVAGLLGFAACGSDDGPPTGLEPDPEPAGFQIEIRYVEGTDPTPAQRAMFGQAVVRWEEVIVGDVPAVRVRQPAPFACQKLTAPPLDEEIDDIVVFVEFGPLDGPGGVIGWAGVCVVRDGFLPVVSSITLDEEDQDWFSVPLVLHELGHALGFTADVWLPLGLLKDPSDPANGRPGPLEAVADATVSEWYAEDNFGLPDGRPLSENLVVGESLGTWTEGPGDDQLMSLIQFDLEGVLAAPPLGAILQLTPTEAQGDGGDIVSPHGAAASWNEATVTWSTMPSFGTQLGNALPATCAPTCDLEVTRQVADWVLGGPNHGLIVRPAFTNTFDASVGFHTRHAADPAVRPRLLFHVDTHFAGLAARAAFDALGGTEYEFAKVPVEIGFTPERVGVVDGHWRGYIFPGEIMESGGGTALSAVTIGAMEDIGYEVDRSVADPFEPRVTGFLVLPGEPPAPIDGSGGPLFRVTPRGSFELLSPRTRVPASADSGGARQP